MIRTLTQYFEACRSNMTSGMYLLCREELGLTSVHLEELDVGYVPALINKKGENKVEDAWVIPERNAKGEVVSLMRRYRRGGKFYVEGSKHGLYYKYNSKSNKSKKRYNPGNHGWMRVDHVDYPGDGCPVCGKPDWCSVSLDDPANPPAVICARVKSRRKLTNNAWLHILDEERNLGGYDRVINMTTDGPVLIVEGFSDTAAALDIGFDVIGRASNLSDTKELMKMPIGDRIIWVIGENDKKENGDWPGRTGVDKVAAELKHMCTIIRVYPPTGVKDLRAWVQGGLTHDELVKYATEHGDGSEVIDPDLLDDDIPMNIARRFIKETYLHDDKLTLRKYKREWYLWDGIKYTLISEDHVIADLYRFLDDKRVVMSDGRGNSQVAPFKAKRSNVGDIIATLKTWCMLDVDPPSWTIKKHSFPDPINLITFTNGMLDVEKYLEGEVVLYDPTPDLFTLNCCPYEYNEGARSPFVEQFLTSIFDDQESVDLAWEYAGYLLTPDISREKIMLLHGKSRAGKGTMIDMYGHMLGSHAHTATDFESMIGTHGLEDMVGKLMCSIGDIRNPQSRIMSRALELKLRIVGGDPVPINKKNIPIFRARLVCRFIMAMNELPSFMDHSGAMESRLLILSFPHGHVKDSSPHIKMKVASEARQGNLINYALEGLKRLRANDMFSEPPSSEPVWTQFRSVASPISTFVDECCHVAEDNTESLDCMFAAWRGWCKRNARKEFLPELFCRWVLGHLPRVQEMYSDIGNRRIKTFKGVSLNEWAQNNLLEN